MKLVTPQQIAGHIKVIADSGITCEQFQAFHESGRFSALLREFIEDEDSESTIDTYMVYMVTVDYDQPLADMIEAGDYGWIDDDITVEHFPINKRESGEVELHLVHFGREMTTKEVLAELDKRGLRPAELPELLALGSVHPNLQRDYPLVALGSEWRHPSGDVNVPFLYEDGAERSLYLGWSSWDDDDRFVAVSK